MYILLYDEIRDQWELIMFSAASAQRLATRATRPCLWPRPSGLGGLRGRWSGATGFSAAGRLLPQCQASADSGNELLSASFRMQQKRRQFGYLLPWGMQHLAVNIARLPDFARARTRGRHKNSCVTKMAGSGVEATQKARAALGGLGPLEPASDRSPGPHG